MLAVIKVHNNEIGRGFQVESQDEGIQKVKELVKEKLNRDLTTNEEYFIENNCEYFCEEDLDNQWVIGLVEIE